MHVALHHVVDDVAHHFVAAALEGFRSPFLEAGLLDLIDGFQKTAVILAVDRDFRVAPGGEELFLPPKMVFGKGDQPFDKRDRLFLMSRGQGCLDCVHQDDDRAVIAVDFGDAEFKGFEPFHGHQDMLPIKQ